MTTRQRVNFAAGNIASLQPATAGQNTTITGNGFPVPNAGYYIPITLNPGYYGANNSSGPEIAYITSGGTSTVANVTRYVETTTQTASGTNVPWVAGALVSDFDVSNLTSTGTLTLSNGFSTNSGVITGGSNALKFTGAYATINGLYALNSAYGAFQQQVTAGAGSTPFPLSTVSGSYVSISNYTISTTASAVANIAINLTASGSYLVVGQLAISNNGASTYTATLWLSTSGTATQTNAPIASEVTVPANSIITIPMNGLVITTGSATLTLYGQSSTGAGTSLSIAGGIGSTGATLNNIVVTRIV